MFVQLIEAKTSKAAEVKAAIQRWQTELAGDAAGWLGTTGGVSDDGTFVAAARFQDEESARANSDRPEQGAWWAQVEPLFDGPVTFHDCTDVTTFGQGGADDAGFVQVMHGRVKDPAAMKALSAEMDAANSGSFRPDVIGGYTVLHGDGNDFTSIAYFTSEGEARAGEQKEIPPEMQELMERDQALYEGEWTYIDLREPWLASPRR